MKTQVSDTSIAAYRALPVKQLATQADRIHEIADDLHGFTLSLKEIQRIYRARHGDIELSTISARVNALVAAKRLERLETTRKCTISGVSIHPVRAVLQ